MHRRAAHCCASVKPELVFSNENHYHLSEAEKNQLRKGVFMSATPEQRVDAETLSATALFLMTEYMEYRCPMLAALIAGELLALERQCGPDSSLAGVSSRLRYRWWKLSQAGEAS
jgi:hypothetical protein